MENKLVKFLAVGPKENGRDDQHGTASTLEPRISQPVKTSDAGAMQRSCPLAPRLIRRTHAAKKLLGDAAYDSAALRQWREERGTKTVIPNKSNRKQPFSFDKKTYRQRHRIANAFRRLKDFRRIAARYDRLARNLLASVCLVAAIVWWVS